jgi:Zn-finger nucleic acid-binding protein
MPAQAPCPKCRGAFIEIDRGGIKIDVCQECRSVFLDRGELDQIIAAEQRAVSNVYTEDESFFRQLAGQPSTPPVQVTPQPTPVAQPAPPVQPQQPAYTPPPVQPAQPTYTQPPAQPAYTPPAPQHTHSAPPQQPVYGQQGQHGQHGQGGYHHQQYGFDVKTAERLLGDFRSHQSSHKKKHQKSLLQQRRVVRT